MKMDDWSRMARDIGEVYSHYEGFVVLHGTDTLAYTASALSFMLQNLGRTPAHVLLEVTNILFSTCTNIHRTLLMCSSDKSSILSQ